MECPQSLQYFMTTVKSSWQQISAELYGHYVTGATGVRSPI
jgi:hypothetical protein